MPDAPPPIRNRAGTIVAPWTLRMGYDTTTDKITLTVDRAESDWAGSLHVETIHDPVDLDDALAQASRFARACAAVRLF